VDTTGRTHYTHVSNKLYDGGHKHTRVSIDIVSNSNFNQIQAWPCLCLHPVQRVCGRQYNNFVLSYLLCAVLCSYLQRNKCPNTARLSDNNYLNSFYLAIIFNIENALRASVEGKHVGDAVATGHDADKNAVHESGLSSCSTVSYMRERQLCCFVDFGFSTFKLSRVEQLARCT
jgi:hypothetical protein